MKNALTLIIYPRTPLRTRTKKYQGYVNMIVMADDAMVDNSYNNETEIKKTELRKYKYLNEKIGKNIYNLNINLKEIGEPIRVEKIIEDGWKDWNSSYPVYIFTPTGSGKNTFVKNNLILPEKRTLILSNRTALNIQVKREMAEIAKKNWPQIEIYEDPKWLKKNRHFGGLDICNYQGLESLIKENKENKVPDYDYVVCDEVHFFLSDSEFNVETYRLLKKIVENFTNSIRIYMTATPERIFKHIFDLEEEQYQVRASNESINNWVKFNEKTYIQASTPVFYLAKENYSYIEPKILDDIDELVRIIHEDKSEEKWLIFVDNKEKGVWLETKLKASIAELNSMEFDKLKEKIINDGFGKFNNGFDENAVKAFEKIMNKALEEMKAIVAPKATFIHANKKNIGYDKMQVDEYSYKLANTNTFSEKVLISTAILDNGFSLTDPSIKNIVIENLDKITFLQMLGRKRISIGEKVKLFLIKPNFRSLATTKNNLKEQLDILKKVKYRKFQEVKDQYFNKDIYAFEKVEGLVKIKGENLYCNKLAEEQISEKLDFYEKILANKDDPYWANKEQLKWLGKYQDGDSVEQYRFGAPQEELIKFLDSHLDEEILANGTLTEISAAIKKDEKLSEYGKFLYDFKKFYEAAYSKKSKNPYRPPSVADINKNLGAYKLPYVLETQGNYIILKRSIIEEETDIEENE